MNPAGNLRRLSANAKAHVSLLAFGFTYKFIRKVRNQKNNVAIEMTKIKLYLITKTYKIG